MSEVDSQPPRYPLDNRTPIRVVVGEDQALFRAGVVHILEASGFEVLAVAGDAQDLVRKARAHVPDVAVVDIHMPPNFSDDGLLAAKELRASEPGIGILLLSQFVEERYAIALLGDEPEGVGYLVKDRVADVPTFTDAVTRIARGGSVLDPEVVGLLVGRARRPDPIDGLTPREREVLGLMAEGRSNRGIADGLFITVSAVERHVTSVFAKLRLPGDGGEHRRVLAVLRYLRR